MISVIVIRPQHPEEFRARMNEVLDKHAEVAGKLLDEHRPDHPSVHHAVALHKLFMPWYFVMN